MSILAEIIAHKRTEIAALDARSLRRAAESAPAPQDFRAALTRPRNEPVPRLIAELKRASPSKGILAPDVDLFEVADIYADNGAASISVLTDDRFFMGKLETLHDLRFTRKVDLPLLRKDFIIHETQVYESRAHGADAVLLIAAALPEDMLLADLHAVALELGLTPLIEVHDEFEVERVLKLKDVGVVGINNRNLATFDVSLETTERLRPRIPSNVTVVAESGIFSPGDVERLAKANVDAVLVGEALIVASDIAAKVRELTVMGVRPT